MTQGINIFLWGIEFAMLVMSVVLLMGKGSGLIAGYNTAGPEKKSKYNEVKLCRTMGGGLLAITIGVGVSLYYNFNFPSEILQYIIYSAIIISVILMLILANTVCRSK